MLDFLLFGRGQAPVRELPPLDVHAGGIVAALQGPGGAGRFINQRSEAAIDRAWDRYNEPCEFSISRTAYAAAVFRPAASALREAPYNRGIRQGLQVVLPRRFAVSWKLKRVLLD